MSSLEDGFGGGVDDMSANTNLTGCDDSELSYAFRHTPAGLTHKSINWKGAVMFVVLVANLPLSTSSPPFRPHHLPNSLAPMTDDPMTELRCLVEGQDDICIVRISRNQIIDHLRQTIYEMGRSSHFVGCSRLDLVITKVCCIVISM
jgi:hypothetical protein